MSRKISLAIALSSSLMIGGVALAQSTSSQLHPAGQPGLAATSSDSGNMGTGASSSKLGTGSTSHGATGLGNTNVGVMGTGAPAATGHSATGANADKLDGLNQKS